MRLISSIIMLLFIFSCKQSDKENQLLQKEAELIKKEELLNSKRKQLEGKELLVKLNSDVKRNVIHCDNKKFTIKIDRLKNGELRYLSWNKPKTISEEPDLILYDGKVEQQGSGGGYHYFFTNGDWRYTIENNLMGETAESIGIFLKLFKNEKKKLSTKMTDLTAEENDALNSTKNRHSNAVDKPKIEVIEKWPDDIEGCSCYFSRNRAEFKKSEYIYMDNYGDIAYLKINGNLERFRLAKSKSLMSSDRTEATWVNENFEFDIKTEQIGQIDETWQRKGKLTLKQKDGEIIEEDIYGECGC